MKTLGYYLSRDWNPVIDTVQDGDEAYVRLRVPLLPDFAVYGDSVTEVKSRFREALESHLEGYLKVGKVVPEPMQLESLVIGDETDTASNAQAGGNMLKGELITA